MERDSISAIEIRGARVHNLKNISLDVPLNRFVGIAGVSGSGKSSLALGVLYAEGSRRYLEALSTYTRRRMTTAGEADMDMIDHVPAALALHQRPHMPDIRSTFGTATELLNFVRLLFSRIGSHVCPNGHHVPPSAAVALDRPLICPECGASFPGPSAESFAFNSDGACPECGGTGSVRTVDSETLVPDQGRTLEEGAVRAWNQSGIAWMYHVAVALGVRADVPYRDLTDAEKEIILHGEAVTRLVAIPSKTGRLFELNCTYLNAHRAIEEGLRKATSEKGLQKISRFLTVRSCPLCSGTRLSERARGSTVSGRTLPQVCALPLQELCTWMNQVAVEDMDPTLSAMAGNINRQFQACARRLLELGLGYLSMDRASTTLSTGERQRVQLARAVRNRTTGVLYVLDEPSIGLHPSNLEGLLGVIHDLMQHGNSVVLVDHDVRMLRHVEHLIEMGPGAGAEGGTVIAEGSIDDVVQNPRSRIAGFLRGTEEIHVRTVCPEDELFAHGTIRLVTRPIHTVRALDVRIPKGRLTCVTGVSGSGKTTLVLESLIPALQAQASVREGGENVCQDGQRGGENDGLDHDQTDGLRDDLRLPDHVVLIEPCGITRVNLIDASPIGANVRSTVATYSTVLDDLRKLFAATDTAQEAHLGVADFSYNTGSLRCPECDGTGSITMDVQFLPDIDVVCPRCSGRRYSEEVRRFTIPDADGNSQLSLWELMGCTIDEVLQKMPAKGSALIRRIRQKLSRLQSLGTGYLTLGEATTLLSGGEAQRLKLAAEMRRSQEDTVFVFDEPTIGLHPLDVRRLIRIFDTLTDAGATVIVIEHDTDVIVNADYCIDMGPGGGEEGGTVVFSGPGARLPACRESRTGRYLVRTDQTDHDVR